MNTINYVKNTLTINKSLVRSFILPKRPDIVAHTAKLSQYKENPAAESTPDSGFLYDYSGFQFLFRE